jgi:hypothetical protein
MSATGQPSEEELRAAYEAEIKQIGVDQVLIEQVVTLINLGMRRTGLQPGTEDERDPAQVRTAVEAVRALLPLVEQAAGPQAAPIREALSQMQMAYVRMGAGAPGEAPEGVGPGGPAHSPQPSDGPSNPGPPPPGAGQPQPGSGPLQPGSGPPQPGGPADPGAEGDDQAGPAQRSGRLWVPGQR